jgi:hypothetical protein
MPTSPWTEADSIKAVEVWTEYQKQHDLSNRHGQAVGIDPVSGRVWFGQSAQEVAALARTDGIDSPLYVLRV